MIFGNSFGEIALGFIISAASLSLNSGSEEALVYDSLKALGKEEEYIKVNGILNFLIEVAQILAVFIGGVLSDINFQLSYGVAAIISLASLLISLGFYESNKSNLNEKDIIKIHFKECFRIIKNEKRLMKIMLYFGILFSIDTTAHFYMQEYLSLMDFTRSEIAGIFVIKGILSAIGSKYAYIFHNKLGKKGVMKFVSIITGILLMVMYLKGVTAIISFVLMGAMIGAAYPLSSNYINELIPSEQRATLISLDSMLFSFLMIGIFPAVGFAAQHLSMGLTFMILGFILIVEVIAAFYYNRDSN
jgi:predicted MFS family arabinose efflux permease